MDDALELRRMLDTKHQVHHAPGDATRNQRQQQQWPLQTRQS
jgi:hypothetical protein